MIWEPSYLPGQRPEADSGNYATALRELPAAGALRKATRRSSRTNRSGTPSSTIIFTPVFADLTNSRGATGASRMGRCLPKSTAMPVANWLEAAACGTQPREAAGVGARQTTTPYGQRRGGYARSAHCAASGRRPPETQAKVNETSRMATLVFVGLFALARANRGGAGNSPGAKAWPSQRGAWWPPPRRWRGVR